MDAAEAVGFVIGMTIVFGPLIAIGIWVWASMTWEPRFMRAFERDDRARARRLLDRHAKKKKPRRLPGHRQQMQRSRYVGLWLLGELDAIRAELAEYAGKGSPSYVANVEMFGVLVLAAEDADPAPHVETLEALAAQVQRDSTRLGKGSVELATNIATVGGGLVGRPVNEADGGKFHGHSFSASRLSRILMLRVLVLVAERTGRPGLRFQRMLASMSKRFAAPPPTA